MKCENCGEEFEDKEIKCPHCGQEIKGAEDEGVAKGNKILWWALFMFFLEIGVTFFTGLIYIKKGDCLAIWAGGFIASMLSYLFVSGWGIIIKKISLIEQHLKNKK